MPSQVLWVKTWLRISVRISRMVKMKYYYESTSIYLSLGSKPIGVDCVAIYFSRLILFMLVLTAPHHQPSLPCPGLRPLQVPFWFLWRGFGVHEAEILIQILAL